MLQVKNIKKTYVAGDLKQDALKGVSVNFRNNEFVSILGPSGSGKTTLLNIIGGLDRYTDGDIIINGLSTEKYSDTDWDIYRNNKIGFVFQSYNLIPHQSILANVEMAMTLSGVPKKERRKRALKSLEQVGLGEHISKRPNQLSGGQMQRVAIARALVNDPDILLADEPTGALDSDTSIQIMELLKEVAKDKLVIMVTHNPELAERYSTRIVNLKDGIIISDTDPYSECDAPAEPKKQKKISMSFLTALSLSFNNLRTKRGRTILTAFAGSIGIIGIAMILALSTGMNDYISDVQKNTMSAYPINISSRTIDSSFFSGLRERLADKKHNADDGIYVDYKESGISSSMVSNNLTEFKKYLENPDNDIKSFVGENGIIYTYNTLFNVYAFDPDGRFIDTDSEPDEDFYFGSAFSGGSDFMSRFRSGLSGNDSAVNFSQIMNGTNGEPISRVVTDGYELACGEWPKNYNEVVLVLDKNNSVSAKTLYSLGLLTEDKYRELSEKGKSDKSDETVIFDYADVLGHNFYLVAACDRYVKNDNGTFTYLDDAVMNKDELLANAVGLKITGVIRPTSDTTTATVSTAVAYTSLLTDYIIEHASGSEIVNAQKATPEINVISGQRFDLTTDEEKTAAIINYLKNADDAEKSTAYKLIMYYGAETDTTNKTDMKKASPQSFGVNDNKPTVMALGRIQNPVAPIDADLLRADKAFMVENTGLFDKVTSSVGGLFDKVIGKLIPPTDDNRFDISSLDDETLSNIIDKWLENNGGEFDMSSIDDETMAKIIEKMLENNGGNFDMSSFTGDAAMASMLDKWLDDDPDTKILLRLYDSYIGNTSYEENLSSFGNVNYDSPSSISIYADDFESKEAITKRIEDYNKKADKNNRISYTDYVAKMTSSLTGIINVISYVLIAFVAVSLIVSCIMIGIITHISVMERTKEIGILRSLGASKGNISQVFNAETFIIGCCSGLIGIGITLLLTIPVNSIIERLASSGRMESLSGMAAQLPIKYAVVLVMISILITVLGGLLPAKKAARKDPVAALRTE